LADLEAIGAEQREMMAAPTPFEVKAMVELESLIQVGEIVARSALFREESRGCHFRTDFPGIDNERWLCHCVSSREVGKEPLRREVAVTRLPLPRREAAA
jgi:succinate dehydrogenase/fumarate reductase flavoprotein subunit